MELRKELIEFLKDWYKDNSLMSINKIERMVDKYLSIRPEKNSIIQFKPRCLYDGFCIDKSDKYCNQESPCRYKNLS